MKKEIVELQKKMYEEGMDVYYVPSSDFHLSEYVHPYFTCREFLSGFDGSAGELVVTDNSAHLWVDGRYYLQAEQQLKGSGIELMKMNDEGVPSVIEFISDLADKFLKTHEDKFVIGINGKVTSADFVLELEKPLIDIMLKDENNSDEKYGRIHIKTDEDLVDEIWADRPKLVPHEIYEVPLSSAGLSAEDKLNQMREAMKEAGADYLLLSDLAEIAWLFNLRGSDVAYTPVFYAYALIGKNKTNLYLMRKNALKNVPAGVKIKDYEEIYEDMKHISDNCTVWMDLKTVNYEIYTSPQNDVKVYEEHTPARQLKMVKNPIEIECSRNAHIKDGVALTRFIKWIKEAVNEEDVQTEISASDYLESMRSGQDGFIELSFPTIAGYNSNGAIVHYEATPETNAEIRPEGFFLVDSGGQYTDGTTDVTRTIAMGPLSDEMIDDYTLILKSHIAFARMRYVQGQTGRELDDMVRKPMRDAGLDFKHGISHGVGHMLSVHEDGPVIRDVNEGDAELKAGMIMSNEPGYYKTGEFGIRIENLVLFKDDDDGTVINEPLTCAPYEREAIRKDMLTAEEIEWVDNYHAWVRSTLTPLLDQDVAAWLKTVTEPL